LAGVRRAVLAFLADYGILDAGSDIMNQPIYSKQAEKAIDGMDAPTKARIKDGINRIPAGDIKKLKGYVSTFRLRIGDWRVLFEMTESGVIVKAILPRGEAYKK
jgi:mRNA interferase RelE/StbE